MAKRKPEIKLRSYGVYSQWNRDSKQLPQFRECITDIVAEIDVEFGMIVNIKRAKNEEVRYCIHHPNIPDDNGVPRPPFDGWVFVKSNDWNFYLGDTIWAPIENKVGDWRMTVELHDQIIADKTFRLFLPPHGD